MVKNLELHFLDDGRILAKVPKSEYNLSNVYEVEFSNNFKYVLNFMGLTEAPMSFKKLYSGDKGESLYIVIKE